MNGLKILVAALAIGLLALPDTADANGGRGFFRGGNNNVRFFGSGGCYGGGSNIGYSRIGFSRVGYLGSCSQSYVAPFVSAAYYAPPVYAPPVQQIAYVQPQVYAQPVQQVAYQPQYQQAPLYNTAPATPTCNCVCAPTVYAGQPAAVGGGGFNPYVPGQNLQAPTPAQPPPVAAPQTYTGQTQYVAKRGYAAFF